MSMSRYQMVSKMFLLYHLTWFRGIAGIKFGITRVQRGDFFTNPYASSCRNSYVDDSFCRATNSSCYKNYPGRGNKCCYCRCDSDENTFDVRKLSCAKNDDIRKGCTLRLSTQREGVGPSAIDLNKDGDEEIKALDLARDSKFTVCWFSKLQRMTTTGYENSNPALFIFAGITGKDKFKIRWFGTNDQSYYGKVYRVGIGCRVEEKYGRSKTYHDVERCLVIKSTGTFQMNHPGLPSSMEFPPSVTSLSPALSSVRTTTVSHVASRLPIFIEPSSTIVELNQPVSSAPQLSKSPYLKQHTTSLPAPLSTSQYNAFHSQWTVQLTSYCSSLISSSLTPTSVFLQLSSSHGERGRITHKMSTRTVVVTPVVEKTERPVTGENVNPNYVETRPIITSSVDSEVSKELPSRERRTSEIGTKVVVYLSVTVGVLVFIILAGVVIWFVNSRRKAVKKHDGNPGAVNHTGNTKKGLGYEEGFPMGKIHESHEGVYTAVQEPAIKRTISGGIENVAYVDVIENNVEGYMTLDECRDKISNYQQLTLPENIKCTAPDKVCELSSPVIKRNSTDNEQDDTPEPIYQVVEELKDTTDLDVSPEQEAPDQTYSILEEQPSATSSSGDVSEVYYATVLPEESENNKPLDPPVYADLTQQRNENEYQGLVTRKM